MTMRQGIIRGKISGDNVVGVQALAGFPGQAKA
jgi:hypothetical protein